jgi:thioredoxin-related protein
MKSVLYLAIVFLSVLSCTSEELDVRPAPEIEWVSIEEGLQDAKESGKKVLVNVYTDWCDFCKKMTNTVYPDSTVRSSVYEHFVSVGLNAESEKMVQYQGESLTEKDLARKLGIRSYPTMLFLNSDGELILQSNGYMPANDFNRMLVYMGSNAYLTMEFIDFVPDNSTAKR